MNAETKQYIYEWIAKANIDLVEKNPNVSMFYERWKVLTPAIHGNF